METPVQFPAFKHLTQVFGFRLFFCMPKTKSSKASMAKRHGVINLNAQQKEKPLKQVEAKRAYDAQRYQRYQSHVLK